MVQTFGGPSRFPHAVPLPSGLLLAYYCELHNNRPNFRFPYCFQGHFCKLPLLRMIFNRKYPDTRL